MVARRNLAHVKENPPKLTPEERTRMDAMPDEEITRAAESDPDNPPLSQQEIGRIAIAQRVRNIRRKTGLSQAKFAERYHINPARLRDWEQARYTPDSVSLAYLVVVDANPDEVATLVLTELGTNKSADDTLDQASDPPRQRATGG